MARHNPLVKKRALQKSSRPLAHESAHIHIVRPDPGTHGPSEDTLLAFDADDDMAAIIPMPPEIPSIVRAAITVTVAQRFEFAEDVDAWLHAPNAALGGATPFERLVLADGIAVLRALRGTNDLADVLRSARDICEPGLKLMR